ncbi:Citrate synthase, partial [Pseudomonas amygdali pv. photiniae]
MEWCRTARAG